jgi:cytidylate kinase
MPNLVVIFGPPAAGKAAVGHALAALTGYRLFHNHLTADPAAALFGWGGERFSRVAHRLRDVALGEAADDHSIPGVIFTFVWAFDLTEDTAAVQHYASLFARSGGQVLLVELLASLDTRIQREGSAFRVGLKPVLADVAAARARQHEFEARHRMNSAGALPLAYPHLVIDTERLEPQQAAQAIQAEIEALNRART